MLSSEGNSVVPTAHSTCYSRVGDAGLEPAAPLAKERILVFHRSRLRVVVARFRLRYRISGRILLLVVSGSSQAALRQVGVVIGVERPSAQSVSIYQTI